MKSKKQIASKFLALTNKMFREKQFNRKVEYNRDRKIFMRQNNIVLEDKTTHSTYIYVDGEQVAIMRTRYTKEFNIHERLPKYLDYNL